MVTLNMSKSNPVIKIKSNSVDEILKQLKTKHGKIISSEEEAKKFLALTGVYTPKLKIKKSFRKTSETLNNVA